MTTTIQEDAVRIDASEKWEKDRAVGRYHLHSIRPYDLDDFAQQCAEVRLAFPAKSDTDVRNAARSLLRHPQGIVVTYLYCEAQAEEKPTTLDEELRKTYATV